MSRKVNRLAKSLMNDKQFVISHGRRKPIRSKSIAIHNQLRTSFVFAILIRIFFFPFFVFRWWIRLAQASIGHFLLFNLITIIVIGTYILTCYITLPDVSKLTEYKPLVSSKFYDRNGELIFETSNEKRTYVNINNVPKKLVQAFIAAEDKTFYTNAGFDLYGMARTAIQDVYKLIRGQKLYGASTITQQVVKNVLLSNERTLTRKLKELILARRVATTLPKDKVMEIYLNHIYLGMQAYGVVVASEEYFGKTLAQLSVPEMAMLAALPKAPSAINPFRSYNRAIQRRNWVLLRMFEDGYITQDEYEEYKNTELTVHRKVNQWAPFYAPSFFAQSLMSDEKIGIKKDNILNDGYNIQLTIDGELQRIAQTALNNTIEKYTKDHGFAGALFTYDKKDIEKKTYNELLRAIDEPENLGDRQLAVVVKVEDNETTIGLKDNSFALITFNDMSWAKQKISETQLSGKKMTKCSDVLQVGDVIVVKQKLENSNYYTLEQIPTINGGVLAMNPQTGEILAMVGGYMDQAGGFNRTTQAFRQVGSTIKPFVYATALESGFTPTSIFMDAPLSINLGNGLTWEPENHNKITNGPTTLRIGLEKSKNTVTIRIADAIGMNSIRRSIIRSGINNNPESNLSVALGSVDSSLVKMAKAYASFANEGVLPPTYLISSIQSINNDKTDKHFNKIYFSNCDRNNKCEIDITNDNINKQQDTSLIDLNQQDNESGAVMEQDNEQGDVSTNNQTKQDIKVFSKETAYQIINMLQGAVKRGTSSRLSSLGLPIASKTGTSNGGRDMWNVVISPELVIAVYVGFDQPMDTDNYGSQYALPVSKEILTSISNNENYHFNDFISPESIKFVKINRHTGKQTSDELGGDVIFEAFKETDEILQEEIDENHITNDDNIDITDL